MTELQSKLFEMLKWFDAFCRKNSLSYYAIGGTLLGAIRHKGFIPWDDDIDLALPREDYIKLVQIMKGKRYGKYKLECYDSLNNDYCYPYNKLYDVTTTLVENYRTPLRRGIFIDIFAIDGAGNSKKQAINWCKHINRKYSFYLSRIAAIRPQRSFVKNLAISLIGSIPDSLIDNCELRIRLDDECRKYALNESVYCGNLLGNWGTREIFKTAYIGKATEYQFEGIMIFGFQYYEEYLGQIYGDWMKLPPKEKRKSHHDYLGLDLYNSYECSINHHPRAKEEY